MNKKLCFVLMTSLFGVFQNLSADEKVVVTDIKGEKKELPDFFTGKYAYWMAAGVLENNDKHCEESIRLFIKENLEPRAE